MTPPTIVELVEACDAMAARSRRLFEATGALVAGEPHPATQRWWSTATHRHAWHAELWSNRRPTIPVGTTAATDDQAFDAAPNATDPDRVTRYLDQLRSMGHDLDELAARVDPLLDPATHRVIGLVRRDLDELAATAPAR